MLYNTSLSDGVGMDTNLLKNLINNSFDLLIIIIDKIIDSVYLQAPMLRLSLALRSWTTWNRSKPIFKPSSGI